MKGIITGIVILLGMAIKISYADIFTAQPNTNQQSSHYGASSKTTPSDTRQDFVARYTVS